MTWYAVIHAKSGALYSTGEIVADPLPARFVTIELPAKYTPDEVGVVWDTTTRTFIPAPPEQITIVKVLTPEAVAEIADDPALVIDDKTRATLRDLLKGARFAEAVPTALPVAAEATAEGK